MTQQGFDDYLFAVFGHKTGTAKSYMMAIRIIDELFLHEDVFALHGKSIACIEDFDLLNRIADLFIPNRHNSPRAKTPFSEM